MEDKVSWQEVILEYLKENLLFVGLTLGGLILMGVGLWQYLRIEPEPKVEFVSSSEAEVKGASNTQDQIAIDVEGEVQKPGVYHLKNGVRLQDGLIAAGGLSPQADREYVAKKLNQAQKLTDGMKIYIPKIGEASSNKLLATTEAADEASTPELIADTIEENSGIININSASEKELDTLPKIGPVTAKKIISGRPYAVVEDLVSKKILGQKTFDGLKDKIVAQ